MISTRVMDIKLREAAEGLGEDGSGKKKSKFKTFKKLFGKKKRKESPSSTGISTWKQNQAKSEVIAIESGPVGYDSEDELEESRGTLGSRALSHDSIFIPESGQDPGRPVRIFSQENVCDRIKALQLKIQCNVKMGPPPPGGLPTKRAEDTGMSSEDDGLPRSPPEMSLLHDMGPSTTIKISLVTSSRPQSPEHTNDATVSSRTLDSSLAPAADFSHPPESSSCLDNSAAKHKLLVKPRNQRSSKMRRLSSRTQSESLCDLTWTLEEEDYEEKALPQVRAESPSSGQPEPGGLAALLAPGGARARRARLQHSPALSASLEEGSSAGDGPSSRPATPATETMAAPAPCKEVSSLSPDPSHHREIHKEGPAVGPWALLEDTAEELVCLSEDVGPPLSTLGTEEGMEPSKESIPPPQVDATPSEGGTTPPQEGTPPPQVDATPPQEGIPPVQVDTIPPQEDTPPPQVDATPEPVVTTTLETPSEPGGQDKSVQREEAATQAVPIQEGAGTEPAQAVPIQEGARAEPALVVPIQEGAGTEPAQAVPIPGGAGTEPAQVVPIQEGARAEPALVVPIPGGAGTEPAQAVPIPGGARAEPALVVPIPGGARAEPALARSPPGRKSCLKHKASAMASDAAASAEPDPSARDGEAAPPEPPPEGPERTAPARRGEPRGGKRFSVTSCRARARASRAPEPPARAPAGVRVPLRRSGPAWRSEAALDDVPGPPEPPPRKHADGAPGRGAAGPAERSPFPVQLRSAPLPARPRDGAQDAGARADSGPPAPLAPGARPPTGQGKGRARPPLPRKPLLQSLTLPYPPAGPDAGPPEPERASLPPRPRREKSLHLQRGAEKGLPPTATGSGADGKPTPPWITIARQKRPEVPDQPPSQEDKPGPQVLKSETGKQAKAAERVQEPVKQADFVRSKSFLMAPAKPAGTQRQGSKLSLKEGLQRGISLSHQNLAAQAAMMTEKDLHPLKRASYASSDQPSWMELARKKSQAWSDMPQIIK